MQQPPSHAASAASPKRHRCQGPNTEAVACTIGEAWTIIEPGTGEVVGCDCLQPDPIWAASPRRGPWYASTGWSWMDNDQPSAPRRVAIRTYRVVLPDAIADPRQRTGRFPFLGP